MGERRTQVQNRRGRATERPVTDVTKVFENKAGRYELVQLDHNMVHYTFTNHQGHQTEAAMPVVTWRRLHERVQENAGLAEVSAG